MSGMDVSIPSWPHSQQGEEHGGLTQTSYCYRVGENAQPPGPPLLPEKRGSRSVLSARPTSHDPCHPLDFQVGLGAEFSECPADSRRGDSADYPLLMLLVGMKSTSH